MPARRPRPRGARRGRSEERGQLAEPRAVGGHPRQARRARRRDPAQRPMVVGAQRPAGLGDPVGAQRHRLVQRDVIAQPRRRPSPRHRVPRAVRAPAPAASLSPARPCRPAAPTDPPARAAASRCATSSDAPAMSAPATTIWFGIAADGIPSKHGCVNGRTSGRRTARPRRLGAQATGPCAGRSSSRPSSTASTPCAGSANERSRRTIIPTSISAGGQ